MCVSHALLLSCIRVGKGWLAIIAYLNGWPGLMRLCVDVMVDLLRIPAENEVFGCRIMCPSFLVAFVN